MNNIQGVLMPETAPCGTGGKPTLDCKLAVIQIGLVFGVEKKSNPPQPPPYEGRGYKSITPVGPRDWEEYHVCLMALFASRAMQYRPHA